MLDTPMQRRIQLLLNQVVSEGTERGVQFAAYLDGKLVVDAWSGAVTADGGANVDGDTLFPIFSTTKGIAATVAHLLVERGLISYETPVSKVWPEFGRCGKDGITLRQVLNHSSGVPQMPGGIGFKEMCDWDTICGAIAGLSPLWEPGTKIEYHAMTFGWVVGEVARRVDGRPFGQIVEEEIKHPLGIEGFYVGIPDAVEPRVAILEYPGCEIPDRNATGPEAIPSWMGPLYDIMNRHDVRRACIPATTGIANARSIARHYAALLSGGVDGVSLLPTSRVHLAIEPQAPANPKGAYPDNQGLGYQFINDSALTVLGRRENAFGHAGFGGSVGFADPELRLAAGFTRNLLGERNTLSVILHELRAAMAS